MSGGIMPHCPGTFRPFPATTMPDCSHPHPQSPHLGYIITH